ncbi:MAG: putative phosphoserine phosphatase / 1-acylglycerol-3-phosphate O-acyltransferase, partial [Gammaproteobacteria bacterium]|nr:putative phosphoserine phosphatase / 1-acylglycerol-3-phosphate O-acyltransferase [Gammaproteobacteria bacterium]
MTNIEKAVASIFKGAEDPRIGAFFDFDGTLIDGYSAGAYFSDRLRNREMGLAELVDTAKLMSRGDLNEAEFAEVIGKGIGEWGGRT